MINVWYIGYFVLALLASKGDIRAYATSPNVDAVDRCSSTTVSKTVMYSITAHSGAKTDGENNLDNSKLKKQVAGTSSQRANAVPFIAFPAPLVEQQYLIADLIKGSHDSKVFVPFCTDSRWQIPMQIGMTGAEFLAQYGLQIAPTPATGNGQYYAVAMSLLDIQFDTSNHIEELEQMTRHLKEGIKQASRHAYEVEFPHDIRQAILVSTQLDIDDQELKVPETAEESNLLFQQYIDDIARSPSSISSYVPVEQWGTEVTLRMMAKLLQQPIFVIIASPDLQATPNFQVYQPERVAKSGFMLDTVEAYYIAGSKSEQWFSRLQHVCRDSDSMTNSPIVLLYINFYYSALSCN